jgi:hypothetical protein
MNIGETQREIIVEPIDIPASEPVVDPTLEPAEPVLVPA